MNMPLFYSKVVPVDSTAHRNLCVQSAPTRFGFARSANLIPAVIDEFGAAMQHLPIAFLPGSKNPAAVFVVGLQPGTNLFLNQENRWEGGYLPAYLRRYPFIVGNVPEGEPLLCVDEQYEGLSTSGERLFSDDGEPQAPLIQARDLAAEYKRSADRTDEFGETLQRLGLLTGVSLNVATENGGTSAVHGLLVVDEAAFDRLGADDVRQLHEKRFLKPIIQHLVSLAAVSKLGDRHARNASGAGQSAAVN